MHTKTKQLRTILANDPIGRSEGNGVEATNRISESDRVAESWHRVEGVLRQRIAHTLNLLNLPSRDAVQSLSRRVEKLERDTNRIDHGMTQRLTERSAELERSTDKLRQMGIRLEQATSMATVASLIPAIAHDICTPVGNSNLASSALRVSLQELRSKLESGELHKRELGEFLDRCDQGLAMIETAGARIGDLSESLKHLTVDSASGRRRLFELGGLINEVLTTLGPSLRKTPIQVVTQIDEAFQMDSYPGPLGQVLINLVQNAMLHAFAGRPLGTVRIAAKVVGVDRVRIEVSDDGVGMSREARENIFTPFFTTRPDDGGSGLGLAYSKRLVEAALGGSIVLAATSKSGTRFVINLPMIAAKNGHAKQLHNGE